MALPHLDGRFLPHSDLCVSINFSNHSFVKEKGAGFRELRCKVTENTLKGALTTMLNGDNKQPRRRFPLLPLFFLNFYYVWHVF
jgi:hypothetical protein